MQCLTCGMMNIDPLSHTHTKEQPMSDTLLEPEDQAGEHQVTKSGACVIPGCPCRRWSAQETASVKEVKGDDECAFIHKLVSGNVRCGALREHHSQYTGHEFTESSQHEPAARGGGDARSTAEWYVGSRSSSPHGDATIRAKNVGVDDWVGQVKAALADQIVSEHNEAWRQNA